MPLRFRILAAAPGAPDPGPAVERQVDVADDVTEIRFGRREGLEVVLPFAALSGLHARLVRADGGFFLEDLSSRNGTAREDRVLPPHSRAPLRPGERFRLANIWIVFEGVAAASRPGAGVEGTNTLARRLVRDLFAGRPDGGEVARLTVASGAETGRVLRLERADHDYTVGRDPACDLALNSGDLSRAHAALVRRWEGVFLRDLGSKNGVAVGDEAVPGGGERRLRDGDRVVLGAVFFSFEDPEDRYLRQLEAAAPAAPAAPPAAKSSAHSGVNLSHPDLSRIPAPIEIAPRSGVMAAQADPPLTPRTRAIVAIASMVVFAAIALLVYFFFLP